MFYYCFPVTITLLKSFHIEIDTIADTEKWITYCEKSNHLLNCHIDSYTVKKDKPMEPIIKHSNFFTEALDKTKQ